MKVNFMIEIREISRENKKEFKKFFKFPVDLYKDVPNSCPAIMADEMEEFNPEVNGAFKYAETKMFLAYEDGKVVGRVAAILNKAYNEKMGVKQLRFSRFDFIEKFEVAAKLMEAVKNWAIELKMEQLVGPIGFSDLDKQGMLVEGFDEENLYLTIYNHKYYKDYMERMGMEKVVDWIEYRIKTVPPTKKEDELVKKIMKRSGFEYMETHGAKASKDLVFEALKDIWNEAYAPLYGVVEINDSQIEREYNMLKMIWSDDNIAAISKDGKLIAYGFVAPNLSRALSKAKGKLYPFGIFHLLHDVKHYNAVDCYSIGIKKEYKDLGVNFLMVNRMMHNLQKNNVEYVYTGPMLEHNKKILAQWQPYNPELYRRRRCFGVDVDKVKLS